MNQLLKVDEWQGGSGSWYVGDVHTWTGWHEIAKILGVNEDVNGLIELLRDKYKAIVHSYDEQKDFLFYYWNSDNYKKAHQFKLDINRIARNTNFMVEKVF